MNKMTLLTEHFSLEELTITQVRGVDNSCPKELFARLVETAKELEQVRDLLGQRAIIVTSGYRCQRVNELVGGVPDSAHMRAEACDFICPSFGNPIQIVQAIASSELDFDQLIEEGTWVHIAWSPALRRQVLTKRPAGGYALGVRGQEIS